MSSNRSYWVIIAILVVFMALHIIQSVIDTKYFVIHRQHLVAIEELQNRIAALEKSRQSPFLDRDYYMAPEKFGTIPQRLNACIECHSKPNQDLRRLVKLTSLLRIATDDCGRNNHQLGESDVEN